MKTGLTILKLYVIMPQRLSLPVVVSCAPPSTCDNTECPIYNQVEAGNGYEICMYDAAVWMFTDSTPPITAPSMTQDTKTGFPPVITQATPHGVGLLIQCVSFYLPMEYQQNPPLSDLHVQPWNQTYVAVRQFGGYVTDDAAKKETAALMASLNGTRWIEPIEKSKGELPEYLFAGYNAPFEIIGRVNEIWVPFYL